MVPSSSSALRPSCIGRCDILRNHDGTEEGFSAPETKRSLVTGLIIIHLRVISQPEMRLPDCNYLCCDNNRSR